MADPITPQQQALEQKIKISLITVLEGYQSVTRSMSNMSNMSKSFRDDLGKIVKGFENSTKSLNEFANTSEKAFSKLKSSTYSTFKGIGGLLRRPF